jgi:hypothetical protein
MEIQKERLAKRGNALLNRLSDLNDKGWLVILKLAFSFTEGALWTRFAQAVGPDWMKSIWRHPKRCSDCVGCWMTALEARP